MSWRQPDLFCGEKQPQRTLRPDRAYRPATWSTPKAFAWESMGAWVRLMHRLFALEAPSSDHYRRSRETARELTVARVRECRHDDDLARVEQMLIEARSGRLYGLDRAFTRAERGELLVEVRNRRRLLELGRAAPKAKGARFDIARLPQQALDRLIQSHPDAGLVERLREERFRRILLPCNDIGTTNC
ncbi:MULTISPECIES: hypothetical protein [unclassified Sphingomonas]|uniref:hypothetical protein n=1 Tax=unclassified Sphingomonas TaxID=196159 RepID=UPI00226AAFBD|nr:MULTISPECIES: hypothetical protein [unclassified Sphingomonas]